MVAHFLWQYRIVLSLAYTICAIPIIMLLSYKSGRVIHRKGEWLFSLALLIVLSACGVLLYVLRSVNFLPGWLLFLLVALLVFYCFFLFGVVFTYIQKGSDSLHPERKHALPAWVRGIEIVLSLFDSEEDYWKNLQKIEEADQVENSERSLL
jgi:hypothetical protein